VTSIDGLLKQPDRVSEVPVGEVPGLLVRLGALVAALAARHVANVSNASKVLQVEPTDNRDRNLTADEAAKMLGMKKSWLYRHSGELPFTRRLSRRAVRFSEKGIRRWLETRHHGGPVNGGQRRIRG
jgi:excisionase family DNA binding protein